MASETTLGRGEHRGMSSPSHARGEFSDADVIRASNSLVPLIEWFRTAPKPSLTPDESSTAITPFTQLKGLNDRGEVYPIWSGGAATLYTQRQSLGAYYEKLGIDNITSCKALQKRVDEVTADFDTLSHEDRLLFLTKMKEKNEWGLEMLGWANRFLFTEAHMKNGETDNNSWQDSSVINPRPLPDAYGISPEAFFGEEEEQSVEKKQSLDAYIERVNTELDMPYESIYLHDTIFEKVFPSLTARMVDIYTGQPIVPKNKEPVEVGDPERRSRPLPKTLAGWYTRGLFDTTKISEPTEQSVPLINDTTRLRNIAYVFLPEGSENLERAIEMQQKIQKITLAEVQLWEIPIANEEIKAFDKKIAILREEQRGVKQQQERVMLALQREFFDVAIAGFAQANEPLHKGAERRMQRMVLHAISGGDGTYFMKDLETSNNNRIQNDPSKDKLAAFIPFVKRYAYKEGVFLDPLMTEMRRRCKELGITPAAVAQVIETMQKRESEEEPKPINLDQAMQWFVKEALLEGVSTIDDDGNYLSEDRSLDDFQQSLNFWRRKRQPVVESIIKQLSTEGKTHELAHDETDQESVLIFGIEEEDNTVPDETLEELDFEEIDDPDDGSSLDYAL